jgi:hypothetical protein
MAGAWIPMIGMIVHFLSVKQLRAHNLWILLDLNHGPAVLQLAAAVAVTHQIQYHPVMKMEDFKLSSSHTFNFLLSHLKHSDLILICHFLLLF